MADLPTFLAYLLEEVGAAPQIVVIGLVGDVAQRHREIERGRRWCSDWSCPPRCPTLDVAQDGGQDLLLVEAACSRLLCWCRARLRECGALHRPPPRRARPRRAAPLVVVGDRVPQPVSCRVGPQRIESVEGGLHVLAAQFMERLALVAHLDPRHRSASPTHGHPSHPCATDRQTKAYRGSSRGSPAACCRER